MSFYKVTTIKKPRKVHKCSMCCDPIIGEHLYIKTVQENVFYSMRIHEECYARMNTMCSHCEYSGDCQESIEQCYMDNFGKGL